MKRLCMLLMLVLAMTMQSHQVFAQSVTIPLMPGWNWISIPTMDTLDFQTAMGTVTPVDGDIIKSHWGSAAYSNGQWRGTISQFYPGYGYHYKSSRTMPVFVTFNAQQPVPQVMVTTSELTDITATSAVVGGTVNIDESNHIYARGVCWGTEPNPDIDSSHTSDEAVAGSLSDTLTELTSNTTYYVRAYVVTDYGLAYGNQQSFTTIVEYQYVDLGLPSGTLWATCNVGAEAPEGYGDYYAWGETQPKDNYHWNTYQYCMGTDHTLTKYCSDSEYGYGGFTDNLTILLPEDDAATANWGSGWRMPTKEEWEELFTNTTVAWITQNGVNGQLFTASNGNCLFLPAAGTRYYGGLDYAGSLGFYWSSSLNTDFPGDTWRVFFPSDYYNNNMGLSYRTYGHSIRPVRSSQN